VVGQALRAVAAVLVASVVAACAQASVPSNHGGPSSHVGPSSNVGHAAAAPREYVVCTTALCTVRPQMETRPTAIYPSGDGSFWFSGITWRGWGTATATGTATAHANNCQPDCAQGTFSAYPGTITLTDPKPWHGEMAYTQETVNVPAIHDQATFSTGTVPAPVPTPSPPIVTQPPSPGPVSTGATLTGSCVMGYEPAYNTSDGSIAYGPFTDGRPIPYTTIGNTQYTPAVAYQVTLTNNGSTTARVAGWAVAFYDASGTELGSDDEPGGAGDTFITARQSFTWTLHSGTDTYGNGVGSNATGQQDDSIPSGGSAATCTIVTWYNG